MFIKVMCFTALTALAVAVDHEENGPYGLVRSLAHKLRHHGSGHQKHVPHAMHEHVPHHQPMPYQLHGPQHVLHDHAPQQPYQLHGHMNDHAPLPHQIHQQYPVHVPHRHQLHGLHHASMQHHGHGLGLHEHYDEKHHQHGHHPHHGTVSPHTYFLGVDDPQMWTGQSEKGRIEGHGHVEHHADTWYHH
ncbi:histidine-rich glycoprotein-like [Cydia pomonella]|uniref:histidine-rich glycoprotein-like n=1 Tax=Cydia pomonella TaxID=82600 RepID=UPI002ADE8B70|nr:histidine-rich glycoprotein-like [Cydia pomonella]